MAAAIRTHGSARPATVKVAGNLLTTAKYWVRVIHMNKDYGVVPKQVDEHADHVGHGVCIATAAVRTLAIYRDDYRTSQFNVGTVTQLELS